LFLLAKIVKTRGNKGEVVILLSDSLPDLLEPGLRLILKRGGKLREVEVETSRVVNGSLLVKFNGIDTMTDAYGLVGCDVCSISEPVHAPDSEEGAGFAGWSLYDQHDRLVGVINGTLDRVVQPLLLVCDDHGKEHLVPLVEEWVLSVNPEAGRIVMSLPEGLIGIN